VGTPRPRERVSPKGRIRPFWVGALSGAGGAAIAATFAFLLLVPRFTNPLLDELVSAHVRSLMPSHLIDVVSTDKHTVKPWFAGHADVSPVVADFEPQGYRLVGGRVDYLEHQRSAVVVYQHGAHVINVFSWGGQGRALPADVTRSGYHLAFWKRGTWSIAPSRIPVGTSFWVWSGSSRNKIHRSEVFSPEPQQGDERVG